jgi:phosphatidylinositol alpha-1,6-mannosyltransferase
MIPFLKVIGISNVIAILHGSEIGKGFWSKWLFFCLNKADNIIAVSKFTRSLLPVRLRSISTVIHNGVDPDQWYPEKDKPVLNNYPILLTVGSISLRKGQYNVVSALPSIKKSFPNVHYHCLGAVGQKDILLDRVRELGVEKMVTIHGVVSHTTLENMYNKAHVNMMLSGYDLDGEVEGYGISVLEGNIFGIPTIGAKHSGLTESIFPRVNGLLVDPKNPEEIVNALRGISSDYKKYSHRSRQYASNNTWAHRIPLYEKSLV